jgi:hypothetical protein
MTTSVSTRSAGRLNPTRQQLDELDALLQRMLDLPVHPLDEAEQAEDEEPAEEEPPPVMNHLEQPPSADRPSPNPLLDAPVAHPQPATRPISPPMSSYMVIETASPRPLPAASGFEPRQPTARLVPVTPQPEMPAAPVKSEEQEVKSEEQPSPLSSLPTPYFDPTADEPPSQEPNADEAWVPLRSTWQPSPQTWPPLAESWHQANGGTTPMAESHPIASPRIDPMRVVAPTKSEEQEVQSEEETSSSPPASPSAPPSSLQQPRLHLSAEDAPATVPAPLLPLVWFNQGFDACLAPLGAPGRWLCGSGRSALGLLGLACLAAAVVIALSARMAWTW